MASVSHQLFRYVDSEPQYVLTSVSRLGRAGQLTLKNDLFEQWSHGYSARSPPQNEAAQSDLDRASRVFKTFSFFPRVSAATRMR